MAGNYFSTDTIAAVATSLAGDGGVGVIRLSGPASLLSARAVCAGLESPEPRYLHRIEVVQPESKNTVDDGLGVFFPEGQSFTGEEVVELQLHGGRFLLQSVLQLLIATGKCRLALPGEFSFRAVRNGKLTLSGAEAVGQLIGAKSMFEVQAARRSLGQTRSKEFIELGARIRNLLAQSELSIDFIDQDVEVISLEALKAELKALVTKEMELLDQMRAAQRIARGLKVTLVGVPNAGKSTLFNALLSEDRAIVSAEAGTTRDIITEEIVVGPYYVRLADTAGIRSGGGAIEMEGIGRAKGLAADSDVVVLVVDATLSGLELEANIAQAVAYGVRPIVALNKADTVGLAERSALLAEIRAGFSGAVVEVSALRGTGLDRLIAAVRGELDQRFGLGLNSFLPTQFQLQMLLESKEALDQACELVDRVGLAHPELVSAALGGAVRALSDLVGETTPDTVLAKIFSEFCIGK